MIIIRTARPGFSYGEAAYYGWRHSFHIGLWIAFWGPTP